MERFDSTSVKTAAFRRIDDNADNFMKIRDVVSDRMHGEPGADGGVWLSVLIPTYERKVLFRQALQSVLTQEPVEYRWEILVVDNTPLDEQGSTPALEAIQEIGDSRVLYYHNRENLGSGYNWNRGVDLARGEWVCFLHDDDLLCSDALRNIGRQLSGYRGKRSLGYLHSRRLDFSNTFETPAPRRFPPERLTRFGMTVSGCTGAGAPTCGTTIRKEAYLETGGINYDFGGSADAVLCCQIMRHYAVVCSDRILGGYRWNDNETLRKSSLLQLIQTDELLSRYLYGNSPFAAWWGSVFGAASSWRNIRRKQKIAARYGVDTTKEDFQSATTYLEPSEIKKSLFLGLYALYRLLRLADGWMQAILF